MKIGRWKEMEIKGAGERPANPPGMISAFSWKIRSDENLPKRTLKRTEPEKKRDKVQIPWRGNF
jgi:hypothetical protein